MKGQTTAFAIPPALWRRFRRRPEKLAALFEAWSPQQLGLPEDWEPPRYDFGRIWELWLELLNAAGYATAAGLLASRSERFAYCPQACEVWSLTPRQALAVLTDLGGDSWQTVQSRCLALGVTDAAGRQLETQDYATLLGDLDGFRCFLEQTIGAGDYLLLWMS